MYLYGSGFQEDTVTVTSYLAAKGVLQVVGVLMGPGLKKIL